MPYISITLYISVPFVSYIIYKILLIMKLLLARRLYIIVRFSSKKSKETKCRFLCLFPPDAHALSFFIGRNQSGSCRLIQLIAIFSTLDEVF